MKPMTNTDQLEGAWTSLKGKVKEQWGKLTDDDLTRVEGKWDQLVGLIQEKYGDTKEKIEGEIARLRADHDARHVTPPPAPIV
jgi:uncharacterized protein YjbJ (UPF0337 family)